MTDLAFYLIIIIILLGAFIVTQLITAKKTYRKLEFQKERICYFKFMRKFGIREWEIEEEYTKIISFTDLKEKNIELQKIVNKYKL